MRKRLSHRAAAGRVQSVWSPRKRQAFHSSLPTPRPAPGGASALVLESRATRSYPARPGYGRRFTLRLRNSTLAPGGSTGCADCKPMAPEAKVESWASTTFRPL